MFQLIADRAAELDQLGQQYLDSLPLIDRENACERIYNAALSLFIASGEDWEAIPDWAGSVLDGHIPYSAIPRNGSLRYTLGLSLASLDAHLRHLVEIAEGRANDELPFPIVAEMPN